MDAARSLARFRGQPELPRRLRGLVPVGDGLQRFGNFRLGPRWRVQQSCRSCQLGEHALTQADRRALLLSRYPGTGSARPGCCKVLWPRGCKVAGMGVPAAVTT